MATAQRLELRQGQSLVMTPQLQQAIKLLQLSNIELQAFVAEELEKNPLLEAARDEPVGEAPARDEGPAAPEGPVALDHAVREERLPGASDTALDNGLDNVYADASAADRAQEGAGAADAGAGDWSSLRPSSRGFDDGELSLEGTLARALTLKDHLEEQLCVALKDPAERLIGGFLVDHVGESGWLETTVEDVALRLGAAEADVERVLAVMQRFDPPGVMARSLAECLAIQLRERGRCDPAMQAMLDHLELVAKRDLAGLMRVCGVDADDIAYMIAELRTLNPKPGLAFGGEAPEAVIPDVFVREAQGGGYTVELNADTLPRLLVDRRYLVRVQAKAATKEEKAYLADQLQSANWLVKSLDQRARTIMKVASEIVRQQDGFFAKGVQHLRPLNLRTVADAIGMHESTVSRVTSNKYLHCPRGLFEMKYFFTAAIPAAGGGEAHSAEAVRHRIKELVDREPGDAPLSDEDIVRLLGRAGIDIARRTVAKYREALRIPSSVERRRLKSAASPAPAMAGARG